jgi:serine/threonine protein phosphatase PrpC
MKPAIQTAMQTATGNPQNQDCGEVVTVGTRSVLVVADGAGGLSGGAEAAAMAVDWVRRNTAGLDNADACVNLIRNLDQAMINDRIAGETTCVITVVGGDEIFGASVGDSGAWLMDHVGHVNLTQRQVRKPLVGSGSACPIGFSPKPGSGRQLLMATDGLLKYASSDRIVEICRTSSLQEIAGQLIELVRFHSGSLPDDVTVIVAQL